MLLATSNKDRRQFEAKLGDFGMARVLKPAGQQACGMDACCVSQQALPHIHTSVRGTVTHMPPELLCQDGTFMMSG